MAQNKPYYIIVDIDIKDPVEYGKYMDGVMPLLKDVHSEIMCLKDTIKIYEGEYKSNHYAVTRFDSKEDYEGYYYSPEYQEVRKHRLAGAVTNYVIGFEEIDPEDVVKIMGGGEATQEYLASIEKK